MDNNWNEECELCEELDQSDEGPCPEHAMEAALWRVGED